MAAALLRTRTVTLDVNGIAIDHEAGDCLVVDALTLGPSVDVTWLDSAGNDAGTVLNVLIGRHLHAGGTFDGFRLLGTPGSVVSLLIGPGESDVTSLISSSFVIGHVIVDNAVEITNDAGNPLPVLPKLATVLTDIGLVAATAVAAVLVAASATRRSFRVRNAGPDPVALGGGAVTFATAAMILQFGDAWIEDDAPGAAWKCICDAGKTASLYVLEQS
jgi:hypothetical protein